MVAALFLQYKSPWSRARKKCVTSKVLPLSTEKRRARWKKRKEGEEGREGGRTRGREGGREGGSRQQRENPGKRCEGSFCPYK